MIETIITGSFNTNTYIISNQGECIVVDPGMDFAEAAKKIKEKYDVVAILITHGHIDHIDGIQYFNVPVYIHEAEEDFLSDPTLSLYSQMDLRFPFQRENLDIHLVKEGDKLSLIGYEFEVLHTPGHTRGSVCYCYKNKVLTGDTMFHHSCGRVDFPTGDSLAMNRSLHKILQHYPDFYDIYPGHEEKSTIKQERSNPFL